MLIESRRISEPHLRQERELETGRVPCKNVNWHYQKPVIK